MAWLERWGAAYRIAFRFGGEKHPVNLKASDPKVADGCLARLEEKRGGGRRTHGSGD